MQVSKTGKLNREISVKPTYEPQQIEQHWYKTWEQAGYFKPSGPGDKSGEPYCIMLPPPNVTGTLHMGHGFQMTLMDAMIRYHRMCGDNTLWQVGTDHAGIATQMVVERQLQQENTSRVALGRDAFVERVWEWKAKSDGTIKQQMRRLGTSVDWSTERFTLDEGICTAVLEVFVRLHEEGLIYRGKRLVNWDPVLLTAISDLEVVTEEVNGQMWHIRYPLEDGSGYIIVATTRPETLLGDTAVAVHPDDARYQSLIGKQLLLPLTARLIPIIADDAIDPTFGTGCVKVTPAHDFTDYAIGQRHDLPMINILTPDGKLNEHTPKAYQGLDRTRAREFILHDLTALNLLEKTTPHLLKIPKGEKSGAIIEPYLTDQWFVSAKKLAGPAITAVKNGAIEFVPENWSKIYFQWLENIEDWCISRQLWWGHRIPAWYDAKGNVYVAHSEAEVRNKHNLPHDVVLTQDNDVLDTWFSAALWPFATLGWPEQTNELKTFYPTNLLMTGFDIIFFWVARMVMMGLHFTNQVPFKQVYITGLIRDAEGQKMSKSKGNVLDPIDLIDGISLGDLVKKRTSGLMQPGMAQRIEQNTRKEFPNGISPYGTDALRFTYCAIASPGREIRFDLGRLEGYRNFCNKLWNATRFVLMNTQNQDTGLGAEKISYGLAERWIRSRLHHTITTVIHAFTQYRFDLMAQAIYEFTWNEYCDWYLEFSKPILIANSDDAACRGVRQTLVQVLETLLRLTHPLMPFITEEIWQQVAPLAGKTDATIMLQAYPTIDEQPRDLTAEQEMQWLQKVILAIRNIRGEMNISPKKTLTVLIKNANATTQQRLKTHRDLLMTLAKLETIDIIDTNHALPATATAVVEELELHIPLADLIDKNAEAIRLQKEITKHQAESIKAQQRLDNPNYVEKAPVAVVAKERERVQELNSTINKLQEQLARLETMNS
jgi:valyl-tRNA synthetase